MKKSDFSSTSSQSHIHYHYHYYYPNQILNKDKDNFTNKTAVSTKKSQKEEFSTVKKKSPNRMKTEGNHQDSLNTAKKMRMSDLWKVKSDQNPNHEKEEQKRTIKAKSVVEQQFNIDEDQSQKRTESSIKRSTNTELQSEPNYQLISHYESELTKFKAEIERLKMVEEECIYLRNTVYSHYTENCQNYK